MSIKSKSKKRLAVLVCAAAIILGGTAGAYVFHKFQVRRRLSHDRSEGLAAVKDKNYQLAIDDLSEYLKVHPMDVEALKAYVAARPLAGPEDVQQIRDMLGELRQLVAADPGGINARQQLMVLYGRLGYWPESEAQSQAVLAQKPNDPQALEYLLLAKVRIRGEELNGSKTKHIASAAEIADRWRLAAPSDPQPYFWILQLMAQDQRPPAEIVSKALQLTSAHPNEPLSKIILATAYGMTDNRERAVQLLKEAAASPMPSPEFARILANELNRFGLYSESLKLLEAQAKQHNNSSVAEALASRQWEMGHVDQVIALTDGMETSLSDQGKALRAIALQMKGQTNASAAIAAYLSKAGNPLATAWSLVLAEMTQTTPITPKQLNDLVDACKTALRGIGRTDPSYLEYFMARAYRQLGERELAIDVFTRAASDNQTWPMPLVELSALELDARQPLIAFDHGVEAWYRSGQTSLPAAIVLSKAWMVASETNKNLADTRPAGQVMDLIKQIHKQLPNEEQPLAMYISLLCQSKPARTEEAKTELQKALANNKNLSEEGLLRLAAVSQQYGLGMTDQCYALSEKQHGMTPALAFSEAISRYSQHDAAGGKALFNQAMQKNSAKDSVQWNLNRARYLEIIHDPQAQAVWVSLGDSNPTNLSIQQLVLQAQSVQADHSFLARTIERVKALTGDNALSWKLAQARLTLAGNPSQQDLVKLTQSLRQIIAAAQDLSAPYALLGDCYSRLGNLTEAISQFQIATQKDPTNAVIAIYYAQLLAQHGDFDKSRAALAGIDKNALNDDQRRQAARLSARIGDSASAINLLQASANDVDSQLMLAELYLQQNHIAEVSDLCKKMLSHPNPGAIAFVADFYASQGKMDEARQTLAMLDSLKLPPGAKELALANFESRFESPDRAIAEMKKATVAAPDNAVAWRALIRLELATGQGDAAKQTLNQSKSATQNDPGMAVLRDNQNLLAALCVEPSLRGSIVAVVDAPASDSPVLAALKLIGAAQSTKQSPAQLGAALQKLLDQNPKSLPLRLIVIQQYLAMGTTESANHAAQLASEGIQMFPTAIEPLQLAVQSLLAAAKPNEALGYAKTWRQLTPANPMEADLKTAQVYIALNQPHAAITLIEPYMPKLMVNPDAHAPDIMAYVAALNQTGDMDKSSKILWPLVVKDAAWRQPWIVLASRCNLDISAAAWLKKIEPLLGPDDSRDRSALAAAWHMLAEQTGKHEYAQTSYAIFEQLAKRSDVMPSTLESMAQLDEEQGKVAEAESNYRRALQMQKDLPISLNNLAMLLAKHGGNTSESLDLAKRAVDVAPKIPTIYDTLAFVQASAKDYNGAQLSIQRAVALDPQNVLWRIHQARYFWEGGKHKEAQNVVAQITAMQPTNDNAGKKTMDEWNALKEEIGKQASANNP